jgi:biopolymer transport protein TolQ
MPVADSSAIIQMILYAGPMVRFVLLILLFFSVVSWAIIFAKHFSIRKARKESARFLDLFWDSRDLSEAFASSKRLERSPLAKVFRVAYVELKKVNRSQSSSTGDEGTGQVSLSQKMVGVDNVKRALNGRFDGL